LFYSGGGIVPIPPPCCITDYVFGTAIIDDVEYDAQSGDYTFNIGYPTAVYGQTGLPYEIYIYYELHVAGTIVDSDNITLSGPGQFTVNAPNGGTLIVEVRYKYVNASGSYFSIPGIFQLDQSEGVIRKIVQRGVEMQVIGCRHIEALAHYVSWNGSQPGVAVTVDWYSYDVETTTLQLLASDTEQYSGTIHVEADIFFCLLTFDTNEFPDLDTSDWLGLSAHGELKIQCQ
jgi:hypothetical protein